jgi:hypothetical protein
MPATHSAPVIRAARTWSASTLLWTAALQKASACRRGGAEVLAGSLPIAAAMGVACLGLAIFPAMLPDQCRAFAPSMVVGVGVPPVCLAVLAGLAFAQTQVPSSPISRTRSVFAAGGALSGRGWPPLSDSGRHTIRVPRNDRDTFTRSTGFRQRTGRYPDRRWLSRSRDGDERSHVTHFSDSRTSASDNVAVADPEFGAHPFR